MKHIASTFLLFLFLFSTAGYYFLFLVLESSNRSEIHDRLDNETSLLTFRFYRSDLKDIVFKKQGKEFMLNGEMYDIKSRHEEGDYAVFMPKQLRF